MDRRWAPVLDPLSTADEGRGGARGAGGGLVGHRPARRPPATVAALLAHEAAAVIDRADALDFLTDEAHTDALTGLPNRRAWDAALKRALAQNRRMTVAMLDLDHFKEFNDTFGHPAGDRLLKETAAAWRDQLRSGDVLARIGGEEFALMLDCDADDALEIVERLRDTSRRTAPVPPESPSACPARPSRICWPERPRALRRQGRRSRPNAREPADQRLTFLVEP